MIQEILTYLIVFAAVGYVLYKLFVLFFKAKSSEGCGGSCSCGTKTQFQKRN